MQNPQFRLGALALVVLIGSSSAHAAGWRYFDPQASRTYVPEHIVPADDGSLWTFDWSGNVRHYAADGTVIGALSPSPLLTADTGAPLADGGAILLDRSEGCAVARVDATLRTRWETQLSRFCKEVAPTRDGRYWVSNVRHLFLLDAEGRIVHQIAPDDGVSIGPFAATADGGAVAASGPVDSRIGVFEGAGPIDGGGTLTQYGRDGQVRWRWSRDGLLIRQVRVGADGSIVIAGVDAQNVAATGNVFVAKLDAGGTVRWSHATQGVAAQIVDASIAGDLAYVATEGTRSTLYRFDAAGAVRQHDVCNRPVSVTLLPTTPDASPAFLCRGSGHDRFVRYGAAGETLVDTALPLSSTYFVRRRADGRLLIRGSDGAPSREYLLVTDTDGHVIDPQPLRSSESRQAAGQWLDADGSTYLVTYADRGSREHRISKVDANGKAVWQRVIEQPILWRSAQVSVAAGQVCVTANIDVGASATQHLVECLAQADGALRWTTTIRKGSGMAALYQRTLDDRSLLLVHSTPEWHEVHRYDRDGNRVFATRHSLPILSASISANGRATLSLLGDQNKPQLVQYDTQGRQVFAASVPAAFTAIELAPESTAPDGSVVAFATSDGRDRLWAIAPNGQTAWTQDLLSRTGNGRYVDLARSSDALYVLHDAIDDAAPDAPPHDLRGRVSRHSPRDGTTTWAVEWIDPDQRGPLLDKLGRLAISPAGDTVLVMHARDHKLRVRRYDAANGALAYHGYVACDAYCGRTDAITLDQSGNARAALAITGGQGMTAAIVALPAPPSRNIRVDQPGIAGSWWSPYANGEGLVIDYLPASRTFFAPWFTFSRAGGNDPAGQRWYVVQGTVPANATRVELPITESAGGNFDAAPTVQARIVGKATLSFTDCNNGTMDYAFDAATNDAATGTITLSRLIPATESCLLADGTTQPGAGAAAPANGFDAGMSGSWFEQATSGQGLQFVVQPGGVFFAPWFTFDPAGPSDDPGRQRWFTIQGNLANARNGVVQAPIVQTIGGAFDSVPTNNMTIVGQATVTFGGCDSAKVDYRFDDTESAGAMRALAGTTELIKIGGCTR